MAKKPRPIVLTKIDDEMRQWSALLCSELNTWPDVAAKKMFGMNAFYRTFGSQRAIFACVPDKRAFSSPHTIAVKFESAAPAVQRRMRSDPRMKAEASPFQKWFEYEIGESSDLGDALRWLYDARQAAKAPVAKGARKLTSKGKGSARKPLHSKPPLPK